MFKVPYLFIGLLVSDQQERRKNDPQEMKNVYNDPSYPETVKMLKTRLANLRTKYKDSNELDQKYI
ncbi:MAG: DUF4976 domain-containing protein [Cytophagales bacterium]|nr:DUF4976 domain-containing protein [Cytophagales bacterium]